MSVFRQMAIVARGPDVWAAFELSQSLFHWTRGATTADELPLPVTQRRGVSNELFEQMVRDPSKAASIVYNHSSPFALGFIASDILALISLDPALAKTGFTGKYYLTLVDVKRRRVCPDALLPLPNDPLPRVTLVGDTIVALQQMSDVNGEPAAAIQRFVVAPGQCAWKGL